MQDQKADKTPVDTDADSLYHADSPTDQVAYLQRLLDQAHQEIAEYKRGFLGEIRRPLLMELIALAQAVEAYLDQYGETATAEDYRDFLQSAVLGDIRQALSRYGVEPFICASGSVNRRLQKVVRVETVDDAARSGQVRPMARGYADADRVFQKEQVILYKAQNDSANEGR